MSCVMKFRLVGAELFDADRRTDLWKLIAAFHDFANVTNNIVTFIETGLHSEMSYHFLCVQQPIILGVIRTF